MNPGVPPRDEPALPDGTPVLEFVAHPTTDVFFGTISFPAAEAATVLAGWADYFRAAPEEVT